MCYIYERARRGLRRNTTTAAAAVFCLRLFIYYIILCVILCMSQGPETIYSGYTLGTSIYAPRVMAKYGAVSPFSVHPYIIWFWLIPKVSCYRSPLLKLADFWMENLFIFSNGTAADCHWTQHTHAHVAEQLITYYIYINYIIHVENVKTPSSDNAK
jgi:hypothetical protein